VLFKLALKRIHLSQAAILSRKPGPPLAASSVVKRLYRRLTNEKKKKAEADSTGPLVPPSAPHIVSPISEP
jgi:hypothetical protein